LLTTSRGPRQPMGNAESLAVGCCGTSDADAPIRVLTPGGQGPFRQQAPLFKPANLERVASERVATFETRASHSSVLEFPKWPPSEVQRTSPLQPLRREAFQPPPLVGRTFSGLRDCPPETRDHTFGHGHTFSGQSLVDRTISGQPLVSGASTLVYSARFEGVRLSQAEFDFSRGSTAPNTPPSSAPKTPPQSKLAGAVSDPPPRSPRHVGRPSDPLKGLERPPHDAPSPAVYTYTEASTGNDFSNFSHYTLVGGTGGFDSPRTVNPGP